MITESIYLTVLDLVFYYLILKPCHSLIKAIFQEIKQERTDNDQ